MENENMLEEDHHDEDVFFWMIDININMFINLDKELKTIQKKNLDFQECTQKYLVADSGNRVMNDAFKSIQNKKKSNFIDIYIYYQVRNSHAKNVQKNSYLFQHWKNIQKRIMDFNHYKMEK